MCLRVGRKSWTAMREVARQKGWSGCAPEQARSLTQGIHSREGHWGVKDVKQSRTTVGTAKSPPESRHKENSGQELGWGSITGVGETELATSSKDPVSCRSGLMGQWN